MLNSERGLVDNLVVTADKSARNLDVWVTLTFVFSDGSPGEALILLTNATKDDFDMVKLGGAVVVSGGDTAFVGLEDLCIGVDVALTSLLIIPNNHHVEIPFDVLGLFNRSRARVPFRIPNSF